MMFPLFTDSGDAPLLSFGLSTGAKALFCLPPVAAAARGDCVKLSARPPPLLDTTDDVTPLPPTDCWNITAFGECEGKMTLSVKIQCTLVTEVGCSRVSNGWWCHVCDLTVRSKN